MDGGLKCINIDFYSNEINSVNEITLEKKITNFEASEYTRILEQYNISTKCVPKIAKYSVTIGMRNKYMILKTIWMTTSFLTLGFLPFYMSDNYEITFRAESNKNTSIDISTDKAISIFLLPLALSNYNYSYETYKTSDSNLAISKEIARFIVADLRK